ncbi:MAG: sigma-70 family RNA polymerase sigma factor [Clostridia bacterium]|nr:sigma-70 family RNA polymerase sigma factor [Clostridia bacterium]
MEDYQIVELYWQRSERAIGETAEKYGGLLSGISYSLLESSEDAEECVNDTYLEAWNRMPEDRPLYLGAYLAKIIRCLSISRFRAAHRQKRGRAQELTDELMACIPGGVDPQREYENGMLTASLNRFLADLSEEKRRIFVRRYFYSDQVSDIARHMGISSAKVKTTLFRLRAELKEHLEKEGFSL